MNSPDDVTGSPLVAKSGHYQEEEESEMKVIEDGEYAYQVQTFCLSNRKVERLVGPHGEIVTVFVHKYNVIMPLPIIT